MYTLVGDARGLGNEGARQLVDAKHRHRRAYAGVPADLLRLLIDAAAPRQTEPPKLPRFLRGKQTALI